MLGRRRFAPPWPVEETSACFIVRDRSGQALAHVYFEDEPGRRSAAKLLTPEEARRIALTLLPPGVEAGFLFLYFEGRQLD